MVAPTGGEVPDANPEFTADEMRLVCGDAQTPGWKEIPPNQVEFFLRNFFQERGIFEVEFERTVTDPSRPAHVTARIGSPTQVQAWRISELSGREQDLAEAVQVERKRGVIGKRLTPGLLDQATAWVEQRLSASGYPCARVETTAEAATGILTTQIDLKQKQVFGLFQEQGGESELMPGLLRRYDAFRAGDVFNGDLLEVTARRIQNEGVVQTVYFTAECGPDGVAVVSQSVSPGPPRLVGFGFGANTEGAILGRVSWRNARMGKRGSSLEFMARASFREQLLNGSMTFYLFGYPSRMFVRPYLELRRQEETFFQTVSARAQLTPGTSWDVAHWGLTLRTGPTFDLIYTVRGAGVPSSQFLSWETAARMMSHDFEYWLGSPRTGYSMDLLVDLAAKEALSSANILRLRWGGQFLFNIGELDPPLFVAGIRAGYSTTITDERPSELSALPPGLRTYLGGAADLRGFGRRELGYDGRGGLTSAYLGVELRAAGLIPWGVPVWSIQPFGFLDVGALGRLPALIDSPVYLSPGFGVRVETQIGVFRGTLAHGYSIGTAGDATQVQASRPSHWQLYLSYGEEF